MKTVTHLSRAAFQKLTPDANTCAISINNSAQDAPGNIWEGWRESLILFFDDAESHAEGPGLTLFSEDHADALWEFVSVHRDCDFIVHCEAGISRSAAVASWISLIFDHALIIPGAFCPNPLVTRLLVRRCREEKLGC